MSQSSYGCVCGVVRWTVTCEICRSLPGTAAFSNFPDHGALLPIPSYSARALFVAHHHCLILAKDSSYRLACDGHQRIRQEAEARWEQPNLYLRTQFEEAAALIHTPTVPVSPSSNHTSHSSTRAFPS